MKPHCSTMFNPKLASMASLGLSCAWNRMAAAAATLLWKTQRGVSMPSPRPQKNHSKNETQACPPNLALPCSPPIPLFHRVPSFSLKTQESTILGSSLFGDKPNFITLHPPDPRDKTRKRTEKMNSRVKSIKRSGHVETLRFNCHFLILLAKTKSYLQLPSVLCSSCVRWGWPLFCENPLPGFTDFPMWPSAAGFQSQSCRNTSRDKTFCCVIMDVWVWHLVALCGLQFAIELLFAAKFGSLELFEAAKGLGSMPSIIDSLSNA